ncbi:MAG: choice-of-anchor D domain-containing protein, partial [Nitrospinae bacterium]|nr:choice-of-anchor D domain-containing protein [Nitrospinota bacterium]
MGRRGGEKGIGLLLFLFGLWMWVPLAWSAGPPQRENVELISQVGGSALSVFVQGKVAYVGLGSSLHVVDVSDPASPRSLGQVTLPGLVEDIFVAGSLAYVANGKFGLRVVDVSTPTSPQEIGRLDTLGGYARGVFFSGGFAYVASGTEGLWVIDVSDPANPVQRGQQKVEGLTANGVNVSGSFAYVAAGVGVIGGELQILDISNPDLPLSKSSFPLPSVAYGVHVLGNFAYVANGLGGLRAVDVSKPDAPQKAATYGTPDIALRVYVSLPYAYVADAKGGLRVINVGNPAFFWEVGHLNTPGFNWDGSALGIYGVGSTVYVANGDFGLAVIDVSSPSAPGVLGEYKGASGLAGSVADVFISGIYAYLPAFDYAFQIADFSNLLSPVFKGFYDPPPPTSAEHDPPGLNISSLFVTDDWVGIADGGTVSADGQQYGFRAVQVKDPSAPFEDPAWTQHVPGLGILNPVQGPATDVFLISFSRVPISPPRTDILAYMATPEGLTVVDMGPLPTPPPNVLPVPVKLGSYPAEGARKVFVAANTTATYAYLVGDFGLKILDVTNSANIAEVGSLSTGSTPATSIFVNLPYAYVTVDSELWVIQVYDLAAGRPFASPQRIYDPIPLEGEATGIFFSGSSAYVILSGFGLKVFDFTDPLVRPVSPVAVYETPGQAMDLFIDQGRIYLADGDGGLFILRYPIGPNVKKIGNVKKKMGNLPHSSNDPKQPSAKMAVSAPALDAPQIVLDPTALDFGDVALASSIDLPLTISNAGTQPLTVSSLQLGGAEASQYSLVNPPALPFTLAPNASQSLTVRFSPTTAGSKAASLTFASNDPDEASVQVALSGWGGLVPDIAVEPVALDFGDVEVGASKDLRLTVSNPGAKELIVSSLQFGGANGSEFSLVGAVALPLTLAPGASQLLTVRFSPRAAGAKSGTLTLTSNDPNQPTVSVSLSGGDAPDIDLLPVDDKGKPVLDFTDNLQVGKFEEKTLTIKNVGSRPLTVTSLTVTSLAVDNAFSLVGDVSVPFDVPTGGEKTVTVRFSPIEDGGNANKGTLTIESNDPDESSVDVELKGWGPHITLEPDELDFGTVSPGTSEDRLLTVTNTGAEDLIVDHVTLGKDDPPDPSDDPSVFSLVGLVGPFKLAPGAFRIFTVRFSPISESEDPKTATLTFTSNDSDRKTGKVELSGRGLNAPQITLDLLSDEVLDDPQNLLLDFGTVSTSESKDLTITVTNAGNKDLEVTSLEVGGTNASDFFVVSPAAPKFTLKPGDPPQTITVRFSPISESKDPKTATLIIRSNDPDHDENPKGELPIQVRLSGIAQNAPHIVLDTRVLNFGKVMVRSSKDLTVTVSNEGSQNLIVDPMRLTQFERGTGEFSLEGFKQVGFTLTPKGTPGASQAITVRFKPTSKGTNGGFLDFFSNDPLRPLIWTTLLGEGVDQPQITLDLDSKDPKDVLDFGDVDLGSSKDLSFTISNTGTQDLIVSSLELAEAEFSLVGVVTVPFTLKPGGPPKTITVRFTPTQEGSKAGSLTLVSNDPDRRRAVVTLSGWSPKIEVEPEKLDFGNVAPGASFDRTLTVRNTGAKDLKVTSLTLEGSDFSLVGAVTIPFTLTPKGSAGDSKTLTLRFRPDIDGDRTGKLTLESNDPKRPKVDVVLSGHGGLVPRIEFDP